MSDDMARLRDEVAGVIGRHAPTVDTYGDTRAAGCSGGCDVEVSDQRPYRYHLADALMPLLARVRDEARGEALREAAEDWATGEWNDYFLADDVQDDVGAVRSMERFLLDRAALAEPTGGQP